MGAAILKPQKGLSLEFPKLIEETQFFALWSISDVKELFRRLRIQVHGYALVEAQFESIMTFKEGLTKLISLESLFEILDNDHDGRIDGLELLGGLALCCQASFEDKARFCFELYDFNLTSSISKRQMVMMMMASICGINLLTGGGEELEPDVETIELLSDEAFLKADRDNNGQISYEEFVAWARSNRDLMGAMESLTKVVLDAKLDVESDDSAPETDEAELSDEEPAVEHGSVETNVQSRMERSGILSQSVAMATSNRLYGQRSTLDVKASEIIPNTSGGLNLVTSFQWKEEIFEPTDFKSSRSDKNGPETNLELRWAFGFRTKRGSRNNLCYVMSDTDPDTQKVAYPIAALGVVYDMKLKEQSFYQGHNAEITCLALHPKGLIVGTGDIASNIHIWNVSTMSCQCIIKGIGLYGIQHLAFSPSGDRILSVSLDPDHTVSIFDCSSGEIISSAKGLISPNNVNDVAYSPNGGEVVIVGKKEIKFFEGANGNKRALDSYLAKIGKSGRKQTFFCVTYFNDDVVVGCASGELYRFKAGQCIQIVQAHSMNEPILSISYNPKDGVLVTGAKDSLVKTWDSTLREVGASLDLSEDLDGDGQADNGSSDSAVISVHMLHNRILLGTRGGDMFEAYLPVSGRANESHSLSRVGWSHGIGRFQGLAVHPLRDEFATSGSDRKLRIWSIRSKELSGIRDLPVAGQALSYSPKGDIIAVGMTDGTVGLVDSTTSTLKAYATWKDSGLAITDIKFSPDGTLLAVASMDCNIYMYINNADKKTFRRQAVCRGHKGPLTHLDFSASSQYLQSNSDDYCLLFWDIQGNRINSACSLRNVPWASQTCTLGWSVQGIFATDAAFDAVKSCCALPGVGDIITGNTDHCVKLFRYPSMHPGSLHQSYRGHSSSVSSVTFSYNRRHAISVGESDCSVLLWAHSMERAETSGEDEPGSVNKSNNGISEFIDSRKEIGNVGPKSLLQEAINLNQSSEVIVQIAQLEGPHKNGTRSVRPWKAAVMEPTHCRLEVGGTDVDLELQWIHGYRSHDARNNVRYSSAGSVVYTAAAVGVVYSRSAGKQKFFLGAHADDIIGLAAHPSGQLFATGETGRQPSIIVWSSQDMRSLARIECSHLVGVPLLAFNSKGDLLASVGLDLDHTLVVHDWAKNMTIMRTPTEKREVFCMCYIADSLCETPSAPSSEYEHQSANSNMIVTAGYKHVTFWWGKGQNISSQHGIFGKEVRDVIMCVASGTPGVCVTGSSQGTLLVWQNFKVVANARTHFGETPNETGTYPHTSPIQCMWAIQGTVDCMFEGSGEEELLHGLSTSARYISGDKEGLIATWRLTLDKNAELRLKLVSLLDVSSLRPSPVCPSVRSVSERNGTILLGTIGSEIYEVLEDHVPSLAIAYTALRERRRVKRTDPLPLTSRDGSYSAQPQHLKDNNNNKTGRTDRTVSSPSPTPSLRLTSGHYGGDLWGLATHPNLPVYVTSGDDGMIRCWSLVQHKLMTYLKLPEMSRAIDFHPIDGRDIAVGLSNGDVWIVNAKLLLNPKNVPLVEIDVSLAGYEVMLSEEAMHAAYSTSGISQSMVSGGQGLARLGGKPSDGKSGTGIRPDMRRLVSKNNVWVEEVKYAFTGSTLAVASCEGEIHLYDVDDSYKALNIDFNAPADMTTGPRENQNDISCITHIDFGVILTSTADTIVTYDEVKKMIVTSQDQTNENIETSTKSLPIPMGLKLQSESKLKIDESDTKNKAKKLGVLSSRKLTSRDICIQSVSAKGGGNIMYWRLDGSPILSPDIVKDAWWSTWTLPIGWPAQGIWLPGLDGSEYAINAVARSHSYNSVPVLATADEYGRVKLFNYPCVTPGAPDKCYRGHSNHVTNIKFSYDDSYCITTGGNDKCVFVWGTDVIEEKREREALLCGGTGQTLESILENDHDSFVPFKQPVIRGGDEGAAVKPWVGAIRVPSNFVEPPDLGSAPDESLVLKFVYGYRGWDCRNNISYADSTKEIVYHVAGVGIVFNSEKQEQILNTEHDDDILCLAVHPEGHTVATGETGPNPKIVLWDANTGVTLSVIKHHKKGVSHIAFSANGSLLISIGMDDNRTIAVHNTRTSALVGTGKAGRGVDVYTVSVGADKFVTGGKNHVKFWDLPSATAAGGELSSKAGLYGKNITARTVVSSTFIGSDCVTGMVDGSVVLWKERSSTKSVKAHDGPVTAMCSVEGSAGGGSVSSGGMISGMAGGAGEGTSPCIITGGKDGFVHVFNAQLIKEWTLDLNLSSPQSACPEIQALATKECRVLIGTKGSEIYEVNRLNSVEIYRYVQGHFGTQSEVWGLAVHPLTNKFVTSGDDHTVRLWDGKGLQQIAITNVGSRVRALAYDSDGSHIAAAAFDGRVIILSGDLQSKICEVNVGGSWIQAMAYSPDGQTLAVGSHDDCVYLLSTKTYSCRATCRGHHSYITALDFSADGSRLQTASGDYELLFWDTENGKQILSATEMKDVTWATSTSTLGWGVQGIWPPGADGTDVNSVDQSPNGTLIATGDDFRRVKLFKYPCPKERSAFKEYKGHAEFVVNVKFSRDGEWLYTVGGLDKAVCQFEIKAGAAVSREDVSVSIPISVPAVPLKPRLKAGNSGGRRKK